MRDDAIAPIIAVMLILAALVTFFSIWNAVYVPSLKESAEVEHLQNVESAFEHFSSDIEYAVSSHQDNLVFSEPVQLGGGDVIENSLKSSGALQIQNETDPIYSLNLTDGTGTTVALVNGTIVNFSYEPVNNFWQDQGYRWQYGYINVTKNRDLSTPLNYYNMTDVENEISLSGSLQTFAESFVAASATANATPVQNMTPTPNNQFSFSPMSGNCTSLDLWVVNISASPEHHFVSGNGFGTFKLTTTVYSTQYYSITNISLGSDNGVFGNVTLGSWNTSFNAMNASCYNNIWYDRSSTWNYSQWDLNQITSPVNVTLHQASIEVSAH
jgi:hypothetical protein